MVPIHSKKCLNWGKVENSTKPIFQEVNVCLNVYIIMWYNFEIWSGSFYLGVCPAKLNSRE